MTANGRRRAFAALLLAVAGFAVAQPYPAKPVRLIIPWPAGGPSDIIGRAFAERLAKVLGQPLIIDNRSGASGAIGGEALARATPDGYTLMVQSMTNQIILVATVKQLAFDPVTDFAPITHIAYSPMVLVVNPALPAHSMAELVAAARASPGTIAIASFGQGSPIFTHCTSASIWFAASCGFLSGIGSAPAAWRTALMSTLFSGSTGTTTFL
jgi:tripartite-type tricarboxylate transporter receptor subunit TctC